MRAGDLLRPSFAALSLRRIADGWERRGRPGRKGSWSVRTGEADETLSVHPSTTQAEQAAQQLARRRGAHHVIVHDRYCRLDTVVVESAPKG